MRKERKKGRWRRRNSEKSSLQSVKGQQPTLWFHLASSLSMCVCVCVWASGRAPEQEMTPVYVFVYISAGLHMWALCEYMPARLCLLASSCMHADGLFVCVWCYVHLRQCSVRMKACAQPLGATLCVIAWPVYRDWNKSVGTSVILAVHEAAIDTRMFLKSEWKMWKWVENEDESYGQNVSKQICSPTWPTVYAMSVTTF